MPRSSIIEPARPATSRPSNDARKERALCEKTRKSLIEKLDNWEDHKVWE